MSITEKSFFVTRSNTARKRGFQTGTALFPVKFQGTENPVGREYARCSGGVGFELPGRERERESYANEFSPTPAEDTPGSPLSLYLGASKSGVQTRLTGEEAINNNNPSPSLLCCLLSVSAPSVHKSDVSLSIPRWVFANVCRHR